MAGCKHFLAIILTFLFCTYANAQLAVDRIIVDITADEPPREDVRLSNISETETIYIQVDVLSVKNPGTDEEERKIVDDPAKIGLIASPTKLIIPPQNSQLVRLVSLLPSDGKDQIFRVNFTPVSGEFAAKETAVQFMVGYQVLVIIRPDDAKAKLVSKRNGDTLTISNLGNTNVYLESGKQCDTEEKVNCTPLTENRLYSGNNWKIDLPSKGPVAFDVYNGDTIVERVF